MSEPFAPLGPKATIAAADRIFDVVDRALSIRRGMEKATDRELLSIVIFARQLDRIAKAAAAVPMTLDEAAFVMTPDAYALFAGLREQLAEAGYLPLPQPTAQTEEPAHGEG